MLLIPTYAIFCVLPLPRASLLNYAGMLATRKIVFNFRFFLYSATVTFVANLYKHAREHVDYTKWLILTQILYQVTTSNIRRNKKASRDVPF